MTALDRVAGWFAPVLPEARVAVFRTFLYLFVLVDIHIFVADPIPLSRQPDLPLELLGGERPPYPELVHPDGQRRAVAHWDDHRRTGSDRHQ